MNSKGWDTQDRPVDLDEFRFESTRLFSYHHSSSDREVTVQPRMPYAPTISFYADLKITRLGAFRDRTNLRWLLTEVFKMKAQDFKVSHSKIRTVHMSRNNTNPGALPPLRRKCKGYEGRLIPVTMHVISTV
jgi:hypothetical protein